MCLWTEANQLCSMSGIGRVAVLGTAAAWGPDLVSSLSTARCGLGASRPDPVGIGSRGLHDSDVRYVSEALALVTKPEGALGRPSDSRLARVGFQP